MTSIDSGAIPNPRTALRIAGVPLRAMLAPFAAAYLTGALITDIVYWRSMELFWANMSTWLLFAGAVFSGLTTLVVLIDFLASRGLRAQRPSLWNLVLTLAVFVLAVFNNLVHSRDGWTSVVPTGLALSAATVVVLAVSGWLGLVMVYRYRVGVQS